MPCIIGFYQYIFSTSLLRAFARRALWDGLLWMASSRGCQALEPCPYSMGFQVLDPAVDVSGGGRLGRRNTHVMKL